SLAHIVYFANRPRACQAAAVVRMEVAKLIALFQRDIAFGAFILPPRLGLLGRALRASVHAVTVSGGRDAATAAIGARRGLLGLGEGGKFALPNLRQLLRG